MEARRSGWARWGPPPPAAPVRSMEARRSRGSGGPGGCHGGQEIQQTFSRLFRWIPPLPPRLLRHPLPLINTATSPVAPFSRRPMLPPSLRLAPPASFSAVPSGGLGFHRLMVPCVGEGGEVLVKGGYGGAAAIDDTPIVIVVLPGGSEVDSITGEVREGEIMAVLGASGSGKSTLVDALADRIARDCLQGSVSLNGKPLEGKLLKSISAYVMQDDLLFPMLTVEKTLMFSADFCLPRTLSPSKKKARVQALIDQLGLCAAARTIIGDEGHRGVSSGERRRVSIGTDIIHDPIILSLDEPTSGLNSTSALMVVSVRQRKPRRRFSS